MIKFYKMLAMMVISIVFCVSVSSAATCSCPGLQAPAGGWVPASCGNNFHVNRGVKSASNSCAFNGIPNSTLYATCNFTATWLEYECCHYGKCRRGNYNVTFISCDGTAGVPAPPLNCP